MKPTIRIAVNVAANVMLIKLSTDDMALTESKVNDLIQTNAFNNTATSIFRKVDEVDRYGIEGTHTIVLKADLTHSSTEDRKRKEALSVINYAIAVGITSWAMESEDEPIL